MDSRKQNWEVLARTSRLIEETKALEVFMRTNGMLTKGGTFEQDLLFIETKLRAYQALFTLIAKSDKLTP